MEKGISWQEEKRQEMPEPGIEAERELHMESGAESEQELHMEPGAESGQELHMEPGAESGRDLNVESGDSLLKQIRQTFSCRGVDIRTYSPLTLAFIGDCIFDLIIRTVVVERANAAPDRLHKKKSSIVKAETQARMAESLQEVLTETELSVYRRGRNAKSYTSAKNASIADYRKATGLEALYGYLYLTEQTERMLELLQISLHKNGLEL